MDRLEPLPRLHLCLAFKDWVSLPFQFLCNGATLLNKVVFDRMPFHEVVSNKVVFDRMLFREVGLNEVVLKLWSAEFSLATAAVQPQTTVSRT